ncbi:MAG TPA: trypsin-like peptidase domain-containing protein [Pyrinomonadaceae bacterium]|nr:trypsin-like peptidase domain-containing protein [Pyrinomonadaceae bacterium]
MKNFRNIAQVRQPRESNGLVIHVSSLNDRSTEVVMSDTVKIGPGDDCDVKIRLAQTAADGANGTIIEAKRVDGTYRIVNVDPALDVKLNGRSIKPNKSINDGDEIWIGPSGPSIHFFPITTTTAMVPGRRGTTHVAPFIEQAAMEASATARRDDAKIFLREFTRELVREINPSTKIIIFAIIIFAVVGALYLGFAQYNETRKNRRIIAEQQDRLIAQQDQLQKANLQLTQVIESNKKVLDTLSLGEMLRVNYGAGVCLIYGSYTFVEAGTGRPLRIPESQTTESGATVQNGTEQPELTPDGNGQIAEYPFVGTGFHTGDGFILTNRHVVQPWLADERAQSLTSTVNGKPRLKKLIAFFPESSQPLTLKYKQAGTGSEDLAVCTIDAKDLPPKLPVLPLEKAAESVAIGRIVVTMGYPSGPDRLLAMLDETEARGIQNRYGSTESLLSYLAQTKHIHPLMTQGNITDLDAKRIVYDARTGEGGSGGPLFGPSGRVVGITFAIFTENSASNFAIPIHYAINLLEKAGWTSPTTPEPDQKDAAAALQSGAR